MTCPNGLHWDTCTNYCTRPDDACSIITDIARADAIGAIAGAASGAALGAMAGGAGALPGALAGAVGGSVFNSVAAGLGYVF